MFQINIITQLLAFFIFAIALNIFKLNALLASCAIMLAVLTRVKNHHFYRLMKRLKWFYLVMFLIFSFNTPGEHVFGWPFGVVPTYEGIEEGFAQLLRISTMLAALSLILATNTKQALISGLYFLLSPLKLLGLDIERFAARLWLTLHYVEHQQKPAMNLSIFSNLGESLSAIFNENTHEDVAITLEKPTFNFLDFGLIVLMLGILAYSIFKVFV